MNANAVLHGGIAVAAQGYDPSTKSVCSVGTGSGFQRIWLGGVGTSLKGPLRRSVLSGILGVRLVHHRGPDAIAPGAAVEGARRGEGRAADLFGVKAERGMLRGVLALGNAPAWASVANSLPNPD